MSFTPTDLRTLEVAIRDGILAVTPSLEAARRWNHDEGISQSGPSQRARMFFLEWSAATQVIGGATGNLDYEILATLGIVTHYSAVNPNKLGELLVQDHFDINRYFIDRLDSIVGLLNWESNGFTVIDEDTRIYEHGFDVSYLRR